MAVQMTFVKHPSIKNHFTAEHNGVKYIVSKSSFGWHAKKNAESDGLKYENVGALIHNNRGQAQYACDLHANGGL